MPLSKLTLFFFDSLTIFLKIDLLVIKEPLKLLKYAKRNKTKRQRRIGETIYWYF